MKKENNWTDGRANVQDTTAIRDAVSAVADSTVVEPGCLLYYRQVTDWLRDLSNARGSDHDKEHYCRYYGTLELNDGRQAERLFVLWEFEIFAWALLVEHLAKIVYRSKLNFLLIQRALLPQLALAVHS